MKERQLIFIQPGWQVARMATSFAASSFVFLQGVALSLGQIVAIGAQSAFMLRQGLCHEHMDSMVLSCAMTDALLILAGVLGMVQALGGRLGLTRLLALVDAVFLLLYGVQMLRRARYSNQLRAVVGGDDLSRRAALARAAAFTLLNPHAYPGTVLLVGSIGAQQTSALCGWFVMGAGPVSLFWFVPLGFDTYWLVSRFARPKA